MSYDTPLHLNARCEFCGRFEQDVFHYYQFRPDCNKKTHRRVYACLQCLLQKITCKFVEKL